METNESSSSLKSNDSGIELLSSETLSKNDSDTEQLLVDVTQSDTVTADDELIVMAESDIDADSDFERVNSSTELLIEDVKNLGNRRTQSNSSAISRFCTACIPECLVTQCGPRQCYNSLRNSLMDSYVCVVVSVECLKGCGSCHRRNWTPGEAKSQAIEKLTRVGHSILNLLRLVLDRRVFLSTLLYSLFAFFAIICNEVMFIPSPAYSYTLILVHTHTHTCLLYTSPSPRDATLSRMPSSA